jgi:hypothetical protein
MGALFSEIADAAGRHDLIGKLRTVDLPPDRKDEQYAKLGQLRRFGTGPLQLVNSRFIGRFRDDNRIYLCVQTEGVNLEALDALEADLGEYDVDPTILDESTFLFLAHDFRPFYRVKPRFLQKDEADEVIAIGSDPSYSGHQIDDAVNFFERVSIFTISSDSLLATCGEWFIAAHIAAVAPIFRTGLISQDRVSDFRLLQGLGNVNPENIYYALTSIHWKQVFLEIYKCIEALYYLPWVLTLKNKYGYSETGLTIARQLREGLRWREKEVESIEALFGLLDERLVKNSGLAKTGPFADMNFTTSKASAIGRRIYKIRNVQVHQEDYDDPSPLEISPECWPVVVQYMIVVAVRLYQENGADAGFSYLLPALPQAPPQVVA